jgi:hypothetical protein
MMDNVAKCEMGIGDKALITALQAENERLAADNERFRDVLRQIASCESHVKGDVVSIARQALGDSHE